jgi:hypothetical protein
VIKKHFIVLLCVCCISLVGCGGGTEPSVNNTPPDTNPIDVAAPQNASYCVKNEKEQNSSLVSEVINTSTKTKNTSSILN